MLKLAISTTRGVEHIAILESVVYQPQEGHDDKHRNDHQDIALDDNRLLKIYFFLREQSYTITTLQH